MDREHFIRCGEALHGKFWQTAIAEQLDVSERLVRFWVAGERPIAGWVEGRIAELLEAKRREVEALCADIGRATPPKI